MNNRANFFYGLPNSRLFFSFLHLQWGKIYWEMLKVASLAAHRRSWRGCSSLLYLKTSPKMKIESVKAEREKKSTSRKELTSTGCCNK
jgi:hypothetical protein